jgi:hypothetical protein
MFNSIVKNPTHELSARKAGLTNVERPPFTGDINAEVFALLLNHVLLLLNHVQ